MSTILAFALCIPGYSLLDLGLIVQEKGKLLSFPKDLFPRNNSIDLIAFFDLGLIVTV
ncbi:MAG: hypothetical protein HKN87_06015 [Saprospiraceae bacterium]|nr:hypothetical protein [Saprospiraceae bacterium]